MNARGRRRRGGRTDDFQNPPKRVAHQIQLAISVDAKGTDVPELGEAALKFLREQTGKDFGRDKAAWKKAIEPVEEL